MTVVQWRARRRRSSSVSCPNGNDGVSAIYAAASGLHPMPIERKKGASKSPVACTRASESPLLVMSWLPRHLGKYDHPPVLRENDTLPELLGGVFERNVALTSSKRSRSL